MDLWRLLKSQLLDLCEELGVDAVRSMKKTELVGAIQQEGLGYAEVELAWKRIQVRSELRLDQLVIEIEQKKRELANRKLDVASLGGAVTGVDVATVIGCQVKKREVGKSKWPEDQRLSSDTIAALPRKSNPEPEPRGVACDPVHVNNGKKKEDSLRASNGRSLGDKVDTSESTPRKSSQLRESSAKREKPADEESGKDSDRAGRHPCNSEIKPQDSRETARESVVMEISFDESNHSCLVRLEHEDVEALKDFTCKEERLDKRATSKQRSLKREGGKPEVNHTKELPTDGGCVRKELSSAEDSRLDKEEPSQVHSGALLPSRIGTSDSDKSVADGGSPSTRKKRKKKLRGVSVFRFVPDISNDERHRKLDERHRNLGDRKSKKRTLSSWWRGRKRQNLQAKEPSSGGGDETRGSKLDGSRLDEEGDPSQKTSEQSPCPGRPPKQKKRQRRPDMVSVRQPGPIVSEAERHLKLDDSSFCGPGLSTMPGNGKPGVVRADEPASCGGDESRGHTRDRKEPRRKKAESTRGRPAKSSSSSHDASEIVNSNADMSPSSKRTRPRKKRLRQISVLGSGNDASAKKCQRKPEKCTHSKRKLAPGLKKKKMKRRQSGKRSEGSRKSSKVNEKSQRPSNLTRAFTTLKGEAHPCDAGALREKSTTVSRCFRYRRRRRKNELPPLCRCYAKKKSEPPDYDFKPRLESNESDWKSWRGTKKRRGVG